MAGLLDFFGTPAGQGLLAAGLGAAANARRGNPVNALGQGGLLGLGAYGAAQNLQDKSAQEAQERQLRALTLEKAQRDNTNEKGLLGLQSQYFTPGSAGTPGTAGLNMPPELSAGFTMPATAPTPPKFDLSGFTGAATSKGLMTPLQAMQLQAAAAKDTPFNKLDPKDYTPDSVRAFMSSGGRDHSLLQPRTKAEVAPNGTAYDPYNVKPGTVFADPNKPFSVDPKGGFAPNEPFQTFELKKAATGAARTNNNTTVSVAGPENRYNADVGAGLAKEGLSLVDSAKAAPAAIANAQQIRTALESGAITGTGATVRQGVQKALETAGLVGPGKAASTEALMASLGTLTMDNIKSSGLGAGQGFTNADREFLASAKSGTIESTPANLLRVADLNERAARATYRKGQAVLGRWKSDPALRSVSQDTVLDDIPETKAPSATPAPAPSYRYENGKLVKVQ